MRGFEIPDAVRTLLAEISSLDGLSLRGKTQTAIYRKSKPFLHFHWNDDEIVADVRYGDEWERVPVTTKREQRKLVTDVRSFLGT